MNYLAHLHIASQCQSNLLGNLLGDFVKGDPFMCYPAEIARGVKLHRWVDAYTDQHPLVRRAKECFPAQTRRFSPIALDVFWDHCLATNWSCYHQQPLASFVRWSERQVTSQSRVIILPERFREVSSRMWHGRWLESYAEFDNIDYALKRMSLRSERMGALAGCFEVLEQLYQPLQAIFRDLYPDVLEKAKSIQF